MLSNSAAPENPPTITQHGLYADALHICADLRSKKSRYLSRTDLNVLEIACKQAVYEYELLLALRANRKAFLTQLQSALHDPLPAALGAI